MEIVEREVYMSPLSSPISLISKIWKREYNACVCGLLEMKHWKKHNITQRFDKTLSRYDEE